MSLNMRLWLSGPSAWYNTPMKKRIVIGVSALLAALLLSACAGRGSGGGELNCVVPAIGQADCIILKSGDYTAVIDLGEEDDGAEIIENLHSLGVKKIDCLIITHYDKDHIGGAAETLAAFPVGRALLPDYEKDGKRFDALLSALDAQGLAPEYLKDDISFRLGDMQFFVDVPKGSAADDSDNDFSLVTRVDYGEKRFLFAGDAEERRISELLSTGNLACDVLKLPHHGRCNARTAELLSAAQPRYVIITDSDKNPAEEETLSLLSERGIDFYQTRDGDVRIVTNGSQLAVHRPQNIGNKFGLPQE